MTVPRRIRRGLIEAKGYREREVTKARDVPRRIRRGLIEAFGFLLCERHSHTARSRRIRRGLIEATVRFNVSGQVGRHSNRGVQLIDCSPSCIEESSVKASGMNGSIRYQRRTTSEWEKLIARFEQTGQTRKSFCLSQGVSVSTFDLWRRKLRGSTAQQSGPCESMFVEVSEVEPAQSSSWDVELELGGGWFFECEARGHVEPDLGWSDLALHAADRYALFI